MDQYERKSELPDNFQSKAPIQNLNETCPISKGLIQWHRETCRQFLHTVLFFTL
jgi:hypothetical protein